LEWERMHGAGHEGSRGQYSPDDARVAGRDALIPAGPQPPAPGGSHVVQHRKTVRFYLADSHVASTLRDLHRPLRGTLVRGHVQFGDTAGPRRCDHVSYRPRRYGSWELDIELHDRRLSVGRPKGRCPGEPREIAGP